MIPPEATDDYDRRSFLHVAASAIGISFIPPQAVSAPLTPERLALNKNQFTFLSALADTLLPETDTPGALAAKVPERFDALLANWASSVTKQMYLSFLASLEKALSYGAPSGFERASAQKRNEILSLYDKAAFSAEEPSQDYNDYKKLKALLVACYYLSEVGSTQELRYEFMPGRWDGCIDLTEVERTWAR